MAIIYLLLFSKNVYFPTFMETTRLSTMGATQDVQLKGCSSLLW